MAHTKVLTRFVDYEDQCIIDAYESRGGYQSIRKVLGMSPDVVIEEVKSSGLRGRGGAGFLTGAKWSFVPRNCDKPVYLLCNADESEPGTFKDRMLLERDPHAVIEGIMIASYALGVHWACVYIRGEYAYATEKLQKALLQAYEREYLGHSAFNSGYKLDIIVHRGAGAYICGEETGLINSLEGRPGKPRIKPPFPALVGLYGCPTVVNNAETLCALVWIFQHGAHAYSALGTEKSSGTKLISASGHINNPGVYEIDLGYPVSDFIKNECGGVWKDRKLKAVITGGSSVPVLRAEEIEGVCFDYESLVAAGTMLGSGGFIVMDETTDMVRVCANLQHFYAHESCGQCTPCREGAGWVKKIMNRIDSNNGTTTDLLLLESICEQIQGHTICPFGDALVTPVLSLMSKFGNEFEERIDASLASNIGA